MRKGVRRRYGIPNKRSNMNASKTPHSSVKVSPSKVSNTEQARVIVNDLSRIGAILGLFHLYVGSSYLLTNTRLFNEIPDAVSITVKA